MQVIVGGSGPLSKLAARPHLLLLAAAGLLSGCVYFNSIYNANELFDRSRREIDARNEASGRASLTQSIEKARRMVERNPNSR